MGYSKDRYTEHQTAIRSMQFEVEKALSGIESHWTPLLFDEHGPIKSFLNNKPYSTSQDEYGREENYIWVDFSKGTVAVEPYGGKEELLRRLKVPFELRQDFEVDDTEYNRRRSIPAIVMSIDDAMKYLPAVLTQEREEEDKKYYKQQYGSDYRRYARESRHPETPTFGQPAKSR